jgi:hypothetical protein
MSDARGCTRIRGPRGETNGAYKHGRYTRETKELRQLVRQMTRNAETKLASALIAHGVKKKRSARRRPGSQVEKVLAEILASGQPVPNPFQTIEQIMGQAVRTEDAKRRSGDILHHPLIIVFDFDPDYGYRFLHGRPYRLDALLRCVELGLSGPDYWRLVGDVWIDQLKHGPASQEVEKVWRSAEPGREESMDDKEGLSVAGQQALSRLAFGG